MKFLLRGGLGNRLFIISAAVHFKTAFGPSCIVIPKGLTLTPFERRICTELEILVMEERLIDKARRSAETRLPTCCSNAVSWPRWKLLRQTGCVPIDQIAGSHGVIGYFQCANYAANASDWSSWLEDTVISNSKSIIPSPIPRIQKVALQIRRGDYLAHQDLYGYLPKAYFEQAIDKLGARLGECVVFTDDEKFVRDEFRDWMREAKFASQYFNSSDSVENLYLLSRFDRLVISNSSFGWWGSHLSGGETVAPAIWAHQSVAPSGVLKDDWKLIHDFVTF
ncbi:alpha-1,2-fucosyltransferase [Aquiluna sp. KACHI24]|uniref:alpha-1,2-fucosyltransferase n=1 Tax=Aquiluna sp. KACHI24 TaxID=2968831 RepID=UPI002208FF11|nr:alpha-1,2-fucosyltransferase [Aquiluna sp. KACHI24]BDQ00537.1 hypothetical protein AKACHI_08730 [Aquiluna sp. KACHI24]